MRGNIEVIGTNYAIDILSNGQVCYLPLIENVWVIAEA